MIMLEGLFFFQKENLYYLVRFYVRQKTKRVTYNAMAEHYFLTGSDGRFKSTNGIGLFLSSKSTLL